MGIHYKVIPQESYLYIKSEGKWEGLNPHKQYNTELYQAIVKAQSKRIIVDERDIIYPNNIMDMYDLAHFYDKELPLEARLLHIALVVKEKYKHLASFWELVCQNLGYQFRVFYTIEEAGAWLKSIPS